MKNKKGMNNLILVLFILILIIISIGIYVLLTENSSVQNTNNLSKDNPSKEENKNIYGSKCTNDEDCPTQFTDWACKNESTAERFSSYYYCKDEGICGSSPGGAEYKYCANGCFNGECN